MAEVRRVYAYTHLDAVEDGRVEHVDTGIDSVPHEFDRLLDKSINHRAIRLGHDNSVCGWLGNLGDHDRSLVTVSEMEITVVVSICRCGCLPECLEGVGAGHIRVEDKEWRVILAEDLLGKSQWTG